ncbi:thiamine-phosphate kinase [Reinekea sp.]|uniref:thiamine-phosphate kinase n=1 Tax=Reinekea sp. TaxID=1970455 RepID=UPI00257F46A2|nr:thiamine-phosphate kinase [Reinekea sp.]
MHEFELIQRCFADWPVRHAQVLTGIGDDGLVWQDPRPLVISTDTAVVGRHFPVDASPEQVAGRAFLPALSDLAAMGATPAFFTLALTLPARLNNASEPNTESWIQAFATELRRLAIAHKCMLAGGDTTAGEQLTLTLSVHGTCAQPVLRSGAQVGDAVWVTGQLGQAAAALPFILAGNAVAAPPAWLAAYWQPKPQIALAEQLAVFLHSAIDISDGLLGDAGHLARSSQVDLHLNLNALPLDADLVALGDRGLQYALAGGDDYQLCFTASVNAGEQIERIAQSLGVRVSRIGEVRQGTGQLHWYDDDRKRDLPWQSFEHF